LDRFESAITGETHHAISDDCERRENTGVESYRDAADVIQGQY
jgi:hypothetical protein